jgi:hypothetical protein
VTFDEHAYTLPAKAEADLMQAYFESFDGIPALNAGF